MMTMKGLPSSYNKDMQEDKEPMFDAVDTMMRSIPLIGDVIDKMTVSSTLYILILYIHLYI